MKAIMGFLTVAAMVLAQPPVTAAEKAVVAVFDIETQGVELSQEMLERLSEYLGSRMAAAGKFQVVPREQIRERLIQQKKDSYASCFDQSCQIEIGKELAAEKSLATKLIKLGSRCTVTTTLYDLKRAATGNAATVHGGCSEDDIVNSLDQAVDKLHQVKAAEKPPMPAAAEPAPAPDKQSPPAASPQEPPAAAKAAGAETHDGFFARLAIGGGWGINTVKDDAADEAKISGGANTSSVAVGYVLGGNLAVHGSFFHATMIDPKTEKDGALAEGGANYLLTGFGAGLTYYFMPINIYLSGSVGLAVIKTTIGPLEFTSRAGFGADLVVGKEWWVLDDLGLGVALQGILSSVPTKFDTNHATFVVSGLVSLTYD